MRRLGRPRKGPSISPLQLGRQGLSSVAANRGGTRPRAADAGKYLFWVTVNQLSRMNLWGIYTRRELGIILAWRRKDTQGRWETIGVQDSGL